MLEVQQHDDQEVQHKNRAGIDDDLDGRKKLCMEGDIQAGHVKEHDQQGESTVDGIVQRHNQYRCGSNDEGKIEKEEVFHIKSILCRLSTQRNFALLSPSGF